MQKTFSFSTNSREELIDITASIKRILAESGITSGIVNVYAQGATGAIMIQENWDQSVQTDVVTLLKKLIPKGVWQHDLQV